MKNVAGEDRQERGVGKDEKGDDEEEHQGYLERWLLFDIAQSLAYTAPHALLLAYALSRPGMHQQQGNNHCQVTERIEVVGTSDAKHANRNATNGGTDDPREIKLR